MAIILKNEQFNYSVITGLYSVIFSHLCVLCDLSGEKIIDLCPLSATLAVKKNH
jgi:hypothetical protein